LILCCNVADVLAVALILIGLIVWSMKRIVVLLFVTLVDIKKVIVRIMNNLEHYIELARKLSLRQVNPSAIVGTGYKNAREVAYEYLTRQIAIEYELLKEDKS
jgi:hypothetical protein